MPPVAQRGAPAVALVLRRRRTPCLKGVGDGQGAVGLHEEQIDEGDDADDQDDGEQSQEVCAVAPPTRRPTLARGSVPVTCEDDDLVLEPAVRIGLSPAAVGTHDGWRTLGDRAHPSLIEGIDEPGSIAVRRQQREVIGVVLADIHAVRRGVPVAIGQGHVVEDPAVRHPADEHDPDAIVLDIDIARLGHVRVVTDDDVTPADVLQQGLPGTQVSELGGSRDGIDEQGGSVLGGYVIGIPVIQGLGTALLDPRVIRHGRSPYVRRTACSAVSPSSMLGDAMPPRSRHRAASEGVRIFHGGAADGTRWRVRAQARVVVADADLAALPGDVYRTSLHLPPAHPLVR